MANLFLQMSTMIKAHFSGTDGWLICSNFGEAIGLFYCGHHASGLLCVESVCCHLFNPKEWMPQASGLRPLHRYRPVQIFLAVDCKWGFADAVAGCMP